MSSLATNAITDASGGNTATINSYTPTESNMAGRNRIINGDMRIDQRNAGAAVTSSGSFPVDRFRLGFTMDGACSAQQDTVAPAGFVNSLKFTTTTADTNLGTSQVVFMQQRIEGNNLSDFGWGTSSAQTVTLSFWVRSSLTGTFGGSIQNSAENRSYPFTYAISSANTWEQKSITISGDTSGTWLTTNGIGIRLNFSMGAGSNLSGTAGAWAGADLISATGAVSVVGTSGATFYLTGVQLEAGSVATPFERRSYGQELALCSRYFQTSYNDGVAVGTVTTSGGITNQAQTTVTYVPMTWNFAVKMRANPTMTAYSTQTGTSGKFYSNSPAGDNNVFAGFLGASNATFTTGTTSINATAYVIAHMTASAEL